jgi:hypothetical protein
MSKHIVPRRKYIMKLEIESVSNGYVITVPVSEYSEVERKFVVEEREDILADDNIDEFKAFHKLILQLQDFFGVINSKHNKIGYINGVCSEDKRWEILESMEKSLENPKNDLGD